MPVFQSIEDLTADDIVAVRNLLKNRFPFDYYFESALASGDPTRGIMVTPTGVVQVIAFDTLTVLSVAGDLPQKAWEALRRCAPPLEFHIRPDQLDRLTDAIEHAPTRIESQVLMIHNGPVPAHRSNLRQASMQDLQALEDFYRRFYPQTVFSRWMIDLPFFLIEETGAIVAAAGVLDLERTLSTACLGSFLVRPDCRGRGLGHDLAAALLRHLREKERIDRIFLATTAGNTAAIRLYETLGFRQVATALEVMVAAPG